MFNGRAHLSRRMIAGISVSAFALTALAVPSANAEPSLDEVEAKVGKLYHESEVAQERLNAIKSQMGRKTDRLESLERDLKSQRAEVDEIGAMVADVIADQAQSTTLGPAGQLLFADDPTEFLDGLAASEAFNRHQGELLGELATKSDQLELREKQVKAELKDLAADRKQIAKDRKTVEANLAKAEETLDGLKAEERRRLQIEHAAEEQASRADDRLALPNVPASGRAKVALEYAMQQVGDSYSYGATGPDSWDCSGLTMGAWGAAGVSLPHSSSAQQGSGTPVDQSQLQPGDLVFYYDPVSHVGMYIGDGQIVHAANPNSGVTTTGVNSMPYSGAVRPG
ncbi:MAG: hypothetical protein GEU96_14405 [Propionibacteriales bacterium]|nr:hypothetical protein [Propionibacteriales bacterium]